MFKNISLFIALFSVTKITSAQFVQQEIKVEKYYIKAGLSYNFGIIPSNFRITNYSTVDSTTNYHYTSKRVSFGGGYFYSITGGYIINPLTAIELQLGYFSGSTQTISAKATYASNSSITKIYLFSSNQYTPSMFCVTPLFVLKTKLSETFSSSTKLGPVIGLFPEINIEGYTSGTSNSYAPLSISEHVKYNGSWALGFTTSLGLEYKWNKWLSYTADLSVTAIGYTPSRSQLTKYILNGQDHLDSLNTSQKEIEYVDDYEYDPSVKQDPNKPSQANKFYYSFSSIGLLLGIRIAF